MYTFTMVGCILFKLCHCKWAKAYLLQILGMSRLWHDLLAHGRILKWQFWSLFTQMLFRLWFSKKGRRIFTGHFLVHFLNIFFLRWDLCLLRASWMLAPCTPHIFTKHIAILLFCFLIIRCQSSHAGGRYCMLFIYLSIAYAEHFLSWHLLGHNYFMEWMDIFLFQDGIWLVQGSYNNKGIWIITLICYHGYYFFFFFFATSFTEL